MEEKKPDPRVATFLCKHCAAVNQQAFPEVRVITVKESCNFGISDESRVHKAWSTAIGIAVCILILSAFGSCAADHYFTTEQLKAMPAKYKVHQDTHGGGLGPEFKVRELTPAEKDLRALLDTIQKLEKELDAQKTKASDGK